MKKYLFILASAMLMFAACESQQNEDVDGPDDKYKTYDVNIQLVYPDSCEFGPIKDVKIQLKSNIGQLYESQTDSMGKANFKLPNGIYDATVSEKRTFKNGYSIFNGLTTGITVTDAWDSSKTVEIKLVETRFEEKPSIPKIVIKEIYVGGTQKDDGSGSYNADQYVTLYNNSADTAVIKNICFGVCGTFNAHSPANDYKDGKLIYENDGFIPAGNAIWYLPEMTIAPWDEVVVAIYGGIDHSATYSMSVDLSHADYVLYDIEDFDNPYYISAPSEFIPTDHYFKAYKYGQSNAWVLSVSSPGFMVFSTGDLDPVTFASTDDYFYNGGYINLTPFRSVKVKNEWIIDAIEIYCYDERATSKKRFTPDVDAGYTYLIGDYGYTSYRNVDKEATEALPENKGKIVYNYVHGTDLSTDPSGIDAEASIKKGAHIVYQDTNNSTNDFHMRNQAALRD